MRTAVVWCGIGLVWMLLAAFDQPTVTRLLIGAVWLALGFVQGAVALNDRKHERGFYRTLRPTRADESGEAQ